MIEVNVNTKRVLQQIERKTFFVSAERMNREEKLGKNIIFVSKLRQHY